MIEDKDPRIADLLSSDAPTPRDPVFRIQVLERREHRRFQRRLYTMLAGVLAIILILTFAAGIGSGALGTTGALIVVAALLSAYLAFRRSLPQILRRFTV